MNNDDWFMKLLKEMIKNHYVFSDLGKMKITRDKSSLTTFNFSISINKSVFEDILSEEEKSMLWLENGEIK